jgi:threonine/homoserine/homoserine lactone efflux protein
MAEGISTVLTYAVGVAISPTPIIAGILMLFSARARINGPMFLAGWVFAIGALSAVAYFLADAGDAATDETTSDTISWGKLAVGVFFLLLAAKQWLNRPAPGVQPEMPKWMAGIDSFSPGKALTLGLIVAGVNPKNFLLSVGAGAALAQVGPSTSEAIVSWLVFIVVGSVTIAGPVIYYLVGGEKARASLDSMKQWLAVNNAAVMTVLFLFFGVKLIADALPALG